MALGEADKKEGKGDVGMAHTETCICLSVLQSPQLCWGTMANLKCFV